MKKQIRNNYMILLLPFLFMLVNNKSAAQEDSVKPEEVVKLKYYNENNSMQYLITESYLKTGKKLEPLKNKTFQLYLDSAATENFISKVTTDINGKAKSFLPTTLKTIWDASPVHKFIAVAPGEEDEAAAELEITKAKIQIDTSSAEGVRSITVQVTKYENGEWLPANEVEMRVGVQRLGSILSAGDEPTYTTDSSGTVTVEVTRDSLPGDAKGNITLAAKVDDNDMLGNLLVEKNAAWGVPTIYANNFFEQRTLWSTRFKTPLWLLFTAYSIVLTVWGTLLYLVFQLIKIRKLGKSALV
jgi:hypothetical protein